MAEIRQGQVMAPSRNGRTHDALAEVRAAVRADRLKLERLPVANVQLKPRPARKR